MWGLPWAVFPPAFSFAGVGGGLFPAFRRGTLRLLRSGGGCGSLFCGVAVHWWLLSPVRAVVPFVPAPLQFCFPLCAVLVVSPSPWWVAFLFPAGVCAGVSGLSFFSGLSMAAWLWLAAFSGWASSRWSPSVLSVGPLGVAHGFASLGGLPASQEWVRGCAFVWLSLVLSCAPPR